MKRYLLTATLLVGMSVPAPARANGAGEVRVNASPGPHDVAVLRFDWHDADRDREVPAKVYYPAEADAPAPVVVVSHGLGGSREGYAYLGEHWASHGYISVHLQHLGSDEAVWRDQPEPMQRMREAATDLRAAVNRPLDVSFALDQLERLNGEPGPLRGRLDLERVGIAGHSFGAYTVLASIGQSRRGLRRLGLTLEDERIDAAIAMSSPVPKRGRYEDAFAGIDTPCLHLTGTEDHSIIGTTTPEQRRIPFDHIDGAPQYLVTFEGADHMVFSGRGWRGDRSKDPLFHALIQLVTTAFWDVWLRDDADARQWLDEAEGFEATLGEDGAFERKPGS